MKRPAPRRATLSRPVFPKVSETLLPTSVLELIIAFGLLMIGQIMEGVPGVLVKLTALVLHLIGFMHLTDFVCATVCRKFGFHKPGLHMAIRILIVLYFLFLVYTITKPAV